MSWQALARSLPFGGSRKVECCSSDRSTYVSNSTAGIRIGPCLRCGYKEFEPHGPVTAKQLAEWRKADSDVRGMRRVPDLSAPSEWPSDVLVWLGKAGISVSRAEQLGWGWSARHNRFFLRCEVDGTPTGAGTGRDLTGQKGRPKYVATAASDDYWIGGDSTTSGSGERFAVVVEDILSAVRVSDAGFRTGATMGTSFDDKMLDTLLRDCSVLVSWLDPDAGGEIGNRNLRKAMALREERIVIVRSERDPKYHTREEISSYIQEALA
ncbi:hypothetical protein HOR19_gp17 [Phage MedPE-SWcel-C56]|uniref:DNA primase n=1 Tax=Phage MedPE-SWcel-C56 TaxID=1871314 RepID=A0A1B1IY03_9CAUD|nr:hypothetical protein HOR19_gp17 [Phage MedPE-SWcel-C56]ANS06210.1 hypothetical protein [Phage MedPE-SWcel-C56]